MRGKLTVPRGAGQRPRDRTPPDGSRGVALGSIGDECSDERVSREMPYEKSGDPRHVSSPRRAVVVRGMP
jgi:hypothetical protein